MDWSRQNFGLTINECFATDLLVWSSTVHTAFEKYANIICQEVPYIHVHMKIHMADVTSLYHCVCHCLVDKACMDINGHPSTDKNFLRTNIDTSPLSKF